MKPAIPTRPNATKAAAVRLVLILLAVVWITTPASADRGLPAQYGIDNFGKVSAELYRGAQPDAQGIQKLKELEKVAKSKNQTQLFIETPYRKVTNGCATKNVEL